MSPSLDELLLRWEEAREKGEPISVEELCESYPEQIGELARRAGRLESLDRLFRSAEADLSGEATVPGRPGRAAPLRLGAYEVRGVLGRGGMGVVYEGFDRMLGRAVAVKVLSPALAAPDGADDPLARRFLREARVMARLKHDNIVPVYGADLDAGQPFFVMELVEGGSLRERMSELVRGPIGRCIELVLGIAAGVNHAHDHGVLHRDLKPANVLLDPGGRPRVADFGLACMLDPGEGDEVVSASVDAGPAALPLGATQLTLPGVEPGTPAYMAPEQFRPELGAVGRATDVWALGVILYELLTGQRPFAGTTREELAKQVCDCRPVAPSALRPGLRPELEAACLKCLAPRPEARYADMPALIAELERCRDAASVPPRRGARRWRLALALGGVPAGVALLLALPDWEEQRHRWQAAPAVRALRAGGPADLGARQGRMAYRTRTSAVTTEVVAPDVVRFTTKALDPALIELLPETGVDHFEVEAELRHDQAQHPFSRVGVYVAHSRQMAPSAGHSYVLASFCDIGLHARAYTDAQNRPCAKALLQYVHLGDHGNKPMRASTLEAGGVFYPPNANGTPPGPWRLIRARVNKDTFTLEWMGETHTSPPGPGQATWVAGLAAPGPGLNGPNVDFPARGAIGIYLHGGSVSIRQFRARPVAALPGQ